MYMAKDTRFESLGDRMKMYERIEAGRIFIPTLPIIARIDGRSFHNFTKGMDRPFDSALNHMMVLTTRHLVQETQACMGYTQSDEIILAWHSDDVKSQVWFDGRIHKMVSQLAAQATLRFYTLCEEINPYYAQRMPTFDARVWQVPNRKEGANVFLWREWDATKNSISMASSALYSDRELHGKDSSAKGEVTAIPDATHITVLAQSFTAFFWSGTAGEKVIGLHQLGLSAGAS